jgi:hypothetical protein
MALDLPCQLLTSISKVVNIIFSFSFYPNSKRPKNRIKKVSLNPKVLIKAEDKICSFMKKQVSN